MSANATPTPHRLDAFSATCRQQGLKATPQRVEIFRALAGATDHPTAERIYQRVRKRLPSLSLDTVYRTLRTMEQHGVVIRVGRLEDRSRYDANTSRHGHFICTQCRKILDFHTQALSVMTLSPLIANLGTIHSLNIEALGICHECRSPKSGTHHDKILCSERSAL